MRPPAVFRTLTFTLALALVPCLLQDLVWAAAPSATPFVRSYPTHSSQTITQALASPNLFTSHPPRPFYFMARTMIRFLREPHFRQDTLRVAIPITMGWAIYYLTDNPYWLSGIVITEGITYAGLRLIQKSDVGSHAGWLQRFSLIAAGGAALGMGIALSVFHAPLNGFVALAFTLINSLLMSYASLVRQRSGLQRASTTPSIYQPHVPEHSSGASLFGAVVTGLSVSPWLSHWQPLGNSFQLGVVLIVQAIFFIEAGVTLFFTPVQSRIALAPSAPETPLTWLRKNPELGKGLFLVFILAMMVSVPWNLPILLRQLWHVPMEQIGLSLAVMTSALWVGSRLNIRLQEKTHISAEHAISWRWANFGAGTLLVILGLWTPNFWVAAILVFPALGFFLKMGYVVSKEMSLLSDIKHIYESRVNYSSAVYLGTAFGSALYLWLISGMSIEKTLMTLGFSLIGFQLLLWRSDWMRAFIMLNPGWAFSTLMAIFKGIRDESVLALAQGFVETRLQLFALTWLLYVTIPLLGNDTNAPLPQNVIYIEPAHEGEMAHPRVRKKSKAAMAWTPDRILEDGTPVRLYQTIIVSDTHLRDPHTNALLIEDMLRHNRLELDPDKRAPVAPNDNVGYIDNGDNQDHEKAGRPPLHRDVMRTIITWVASAMAFTRTIAIPGNHNQFWEKRAGKTLPFNPIEIMTHFEWLLPNGRFAHAEHGHLQDKLTREKNKVQSLGTWAYDQGRHLDVWTEQERLLRRLRSGFYLGVWGKWLAKSFLKKFDRANAIATLEALDASGKTTVGIPVSFAGHVHDGKMVYVTVHFFLAEKIFRYLYRHFSKLVSQAPPWIRSRLERKNAELERVARYEGRKVLRVDTDNSQNSTHTAAVGIRPDGTIELIQWRKPFHQDVLAPDLDGRWQRFLRNFSGFRFRWFRIQMPSEKQRSKLRSTHAAALFLLFGLWGAVPWTASAQVLDPKDVPVMVTTHPDLKRAMTQHPADAQRLAQAYKLFLFFRNNGGADFQISNKGNAIESFYDPQVRKVLTDLGGNTEFGKWPESFANNAIEALKRRFSSISSEEADFLIDRFIHPSTPITLTPAGALIFAGGFLRHFGIYDDVRLVMGKDTAIYLQIRLSDQTPFYIRFSEKWEEFGATPEKVKEPTMASVRDYEFADAPNRLLGWTLGTLGKIRGYSHHTHRIFATFFDLRFFEAAARILGPHYTQRLAELEASYPSTAPRKPSRALARAA